MIKKILYTILFLIFLPSLVLCAIQLGRGSWTWDASIPYAREDTWVPDAEDDGLIKVWTQ